MVLKHDFIESRVQIRLIEWYHRIKSKLFLPQKFQSVTLYKNGICFRPLSADRLSEVVSYIPLAIVCIATNFSLHTVDYSLETTIWMSPGRFFILVDFAAVLSYLNAQKTKQKMMWN